MGNENNYQDFMEGQYDGNITKKSVQALQDRQRADRLAQRAEVKMEGAWMAERERIAAETGERGAALDAIMNEYLKEDKYQQYLVDGAILRCENATLDDFELPTGEKVVLEKVTDQSDTERTHIRLCVSENAQEGDTETSMSIGGLAYATVKDTVKGKNIIPPCCNCKIAANRNAEIARIMADPERRKHGVCMHLMQLNDEWRNLWKPGQSYLSKTNRVPVTLTDGLGEEADEVETAAGITMTSMLFCRHGGIILPVTSGQEKSKSIAGSSISAEALRALMELEVLNEFSADYLVIEDGKLIGIKPHLAGDGYVTVGFGDCLQQNDIDYYLDAERSKYISGYLSDDASEYSKMKDTVIPVDICFEKLLSDIEMVYQATLKWFPADMQLSQNQLDAVLIAEYQCYKLKNDTYVSIMNGAGRTELYNYFLKSHGMNGGFESRTTVEMNIYFDANYEVEGGLSGVIVEPLEQFDR